MAMHVGAPCVHCSRGRSGQGGPKIGEDRRLGAHSRVQSGGQGGGARPYVGGKQMVVENDQDGSSLTPIRDYRAELRRGDCQGGGASPTRRRPPREDQPGVGKVIQRRREFT